MSTSTTACSVVPGPTTIAGSSWKSYAWFALCTALYILPFMRTMMVGTDEGTLDYGAIRILHGDTFGRDFFEVIGPGTFYWLAGFFKIFGVSFFATRVSLFITSLGTALMIYFLSRRICGSNRTLPVIMLAATSFGGLWPAISHHDDSNFFALMSIACMSLWIVKGRKSLLFGAGVLAGATTTFLQPKGILLVATLAAFIVLQRRTRSDVMRSIAVLTVGYSCVVAVVLTYFWSRDALHDLIYVNVTWPSQHYGSVNAVPYAHGILSNYWDHWVSARDQFPWTVALAIVMFVPVLCVAGLPVLLPIVGARFRWNITEPQVVLLWLTGFAIWISELHRTDMTHLIFGSPVLMILLVHFITGYAGKIAAAALQLITISSVCLGGFNLLLQTAAHTVSTRVGAVRMFKDAEAISFVQSIIPAGIEIFAYPYAPRYYFLTGTVNPTRYSLLTYNYNTTDQFNEVLSILERNRVEYVVWDIEFQQIEGMVFLGPKPSTDQQIIEPYLLSHYQLIRLVDGKRIMRRRADIDERH